MIISKAVQTLRDNQSNLKNYELVMPLVLTTYESNELRRLRSLVKSADLDVDLLKERNMAHDEALQLINDMRDWLMDCGYQFEYEGAYPCHILRLVAKEYEGGIDAFILAVS